MGRDRKRAEPEPAHDVPDDVAEFSVPAGDDVAAVEEPAARVTRTRPAEDRAKEEQKPPPFGTARPAGAGKLPRVVDQLARAGAGETRFKIACRNYSPQKTRYVLARAGDEDGAVACYLHANGLDKHIAKLKGRAPADKPPEQPELVVTELAD
jgi:hypothetical protein